MTDPLIITLALISVCVIIARFSWLKGYEKGLNDGWEDANDLQETVVKYHIDPFDNMLN